MPLWDVMPPVLTGDADRAVKGPGPLANLSRAQRAGTDTVRPMGGPAADLLLPAQLDEHQLVQFNKLALAHEWNANLPGYDLRELGPFPNDAGYEVIADSLDFDETWVVEASFLPAARIWCSSATNRSESHRALASFVIVLADAFGGVVDLGCEVKPSAPLEGHVTVVSCPVITAHGPDRRVTWLVDAVWLRSWMKDPAFHMTK